MRKSIQILVLGVGMLMLSGCANMRLKQAESAKADVKNICKVALSNPRLNPTRAQIPDYPTQATVAQLADERHATPEQMDAIEHREEYIAPCTTADLNFYSKYLPAAESIYENAHQEAKLLDAKLMTGAMSFGEYNTARSQLFQHAKQTAMQATQAASMREQQQYLQYQQSVINNQNIIKGFTPRTANCYRYGNYVNCTGY